MQLIYKLHFATYLSTLVTYLSATKRKTTRTPYFTYPKCPPCSEGRFGPISVIGHHVSVWKDP